MDEGITLAYAEAYAECVTDKEPPVNGVTRHVKLFRNGRNQAVRIPREMELRGDEAIMRKEGDRLIIEPVEPVSLLGVLAALEPIEDDFAPMPDLAAAPVEL